MSVFLLSFTRAWGIFGGMPERLFAKLFAKSMATNFICLAVATVACVAVADVPLLRACLFMFVLLLLCNEAWHWALAIPALLSAILGALRGKKEQDAPTRGEMRLLRASALLPLLLPHLFFALLLGVDLQLGGMLSRELELPFTPAFFATAFAAPGLLGLIGLVTPLCPLAMEVVVDRIFGPEERV